MRLTAALAVLSVLALACAAEAVVHNVNVSLDGLQETPPVSTPGSGTATVSFDDVTGNMNVSGSFSGLTGTTTAAHVHGYEPAGTPAGIVFGLTIDTGVSSGNFSGSGTIPGANIDDVLNGLTYINIHTSFKTGGEIRGQIIIPEPASLALLGSLAVPALMRRRR